MHKTTMIKQTSHNLKIYRINFFAIIYIIKKPNKLQSYYALSIFSFEHAMFEISFPFHFFHLILLFILLYFVLFENY